MPFQIIRNDITKVAADAIVNSANPDPIYAGAVDRSIYLAAGARKLLAEREKIGPIAVGSAAYTPAFNLPAKYIIHTVGPVWIDGEHGEAASVRSCYTESLKLANDLGCRSIAQQDEFHFGDYLCKLIAEKGMKNSEAYSAANISKQAFSQIKYSKNPPLRSTVAAFAVALHLSEAEAEKLFESAGYSLSKTQKYDRAVRYFLRNHKYNVVENNIVLDNFGLPQLGSNR